MIQASPFKQVASGVTGFSCLRRNSGETFLETFLETLLVKRGEVISMSLLLAYQHRPVLRIEKTAVPVGCEAATVKARMGWINQMFPTDL
jgi:hypothetical protein